MAHWRFVLDESWAGECEAARIASDERTRLALDEMRRIDDVLPGREGDTYFDVTTEMDGLLVRFRVYDYTRGYTDALKDGGTLKEGQ